MSIRRSTESLYRDATRAAWIGLVINVSLGIIKLCGGLLANSFALLTDAVNSIGDSLTSVVVLIALAVARRPADREHPYGHTRAEAIAGSNVALVIILTGSWDCGIEGVGMTVEGFTRGLARVGCATWADHIVTATLILFAVSTIIGWSYYGSRGAQYLFGSRAIVPYLYAYGLFVFLGSLGKIDVVWHFTDMAVTFMTIPNLIAIVLLSSVVYRETKRYFNERAW